jgi:hypothetical protein
MRACKEIGFAKPHKESSGLLLSSKYVCFLNYSKNVDVGNNIFTWLSYAELHKHLVSYPQMLWA